MVVSLGKTLEKIKCKQHGTAILASAGAFAVGGTLGWASPSSKELGSSENLNADKISWIISIVSLGALTSALVTGSLMNKIGRKWTVLISTIPLIIGWVLIIFGSDDFVLLVSGRFLQGLSSGVTPVAGVIYNSEICDKHNRGVISLYIPLILTFGTVFAYIIGACFPINTFNIILASVSIIFISFLVFLPETPSHLMLKQKHEETKKVLLWLKRSPDSFTEIEREIKANNSNHTKITFMEVIKRRTVHRGSLIALCFTITYQFCGLNVVIAYSSEMLRLAKVQIDADFVTIFIGLSKIVGYIVGSQIVDRFGRRVLLLTSLFFAATFISALTIYLVYINELSDNYSWLPILGLIGFVLSITIGVSSVTWICMSELFDVNLRSYAGGIIATFNNASIFLCTFLFNKMTEYIGIVGIFIFFDVICVVGLITSACFIFETKGLSYLEIQNNLKDGPWFVFQNKNSEKKESGQVFKNDML